MKIFIEKRVKGILRFKTTIGNVTLTDDNKGMNELTQEQFDAIKEHPMFEAISKTSGLRVIEKAASKTSSADNKSDEANEDEIDINDIDLSKQNKAQLVVLAESLEIKTEGLNKAQLIEAIEEKKAE